MPGQPLGKRGIRNIDQHKILYARQGYAGHVTRDSQTAGKSAQIPHLADEPRLGRRVDVEVR